MNPRIILLIGAALVVAIGAAFLARWYIQGSQPELVEQVELQETAQIMVAAVSLPMGHIIGIGDLAWQDWPIDGVNANYMEEDAYTLEDLEGSVIRFGITAGEPMTTTQTVSPGERGFLAAVLTPGMRALTIPVARTTGLAGFVFPGDRVDLILTQQLEVETLDTILGDTAGGDDDEPAEDHDASVTFLRNVRVLAVDERTDDIAKIPQVGKSVTIEVTPKLAERVAVALRMGIVSLSLRSLVAPDGQDIIGLNPDENMPTISPQSHTWDYQASHLVKPLVTVGKVRTIVISRGGESETFFVGEDGLLQTRDKDQKD